MNSNFESISTWCKVKFKIIKISPFYFFKKAINHFSEHWSTPYNRRVILDKKAHGDNFNSKTLNRYNLLCTNDRPFLNTHHIGYTESIDIGINNTDLLTKSHQRSC